MATTLRAAPRHASPKPPPVMGLDPQPADDIGAHVAHYIWDIASAS